MTLLETQVDPKKGIRKVVSHTKLPEIPAGKLNPSKNKDLETSKHGFGGISKIKFNKQSSSNLNIHSKTHTTEWVRMGMYSQYLLYLYDKL